MNRSFSISSVFSATKNAMNLATLDGIVAVNSAGNTGSFGSFTTSRTGLFLSVANGQEGGDVLSTHNRGGLSASSGRGPAFGVFHIKPDITAPGSSVRTLNHSGTGYTNASGASLSAPVITGVAALMVEAFPDAAPHEIIARMMNTSRPITFQAENSVFRAGAGFVQPRHALDSEAFATVQNFAGTRPTRRPQL